MANHDDYSNGFRFGTVYARNHGVAALARVIACDVARLRKPLAYVAGECDAALEAVQRDVLERRKVA